MDSSVLVNCTICRRKNLIPQGAYGTYCTRKGCEGWLLLRQIDNSKKYVRISCKNKYYYHLVDFDAKTVKCNCCDMVYDIIPYVVEIRSNQKVRGTMKNAEAKANLVENEQKKAEVFNVDVAEVNNENNILNNLLDMKHSDDEIKKDREEKKEEYLKSWVLKMQQKDLQAKTKRMKTLEEENCSLLEKVAELEAGLKTMETKNNDLENKVLELNDEKRQLKERIAKQSSDNEETRNQLEIARNESNNLMQKMKEINALIEANFEMIQKLTSMSTDAKESKDTDCVTQVSNNTSTKYKKVWKIPCEVCGQQATIPKNFWKAECGTKTCTSYTILAPVDEGHRVVRHVCKNVPYFNRVENSVKSVRCRCCGRDFRITNVVVETRNGQKVFHAGLRNLPETEVIMLRCELKELQSKYDNEMVEAHFEKNSMRLERLQQNSTQNRKEMENMLAKGKLEKENQSLKTNVTCLTEINKMLMKKIKNFESVAEEKKNF